jgi:hypothetical protein
MNLTFKNNKHNMMNTISELYNKENLLSPKQAESLGSTNSDSQVISNGSTIPYSSLLTNENMILQNLKTDEVLKLIVIGDKSVGKSYLIKKICEMTNMINSPTRR